MNRLYLAFPTIASTARFACTPFNGDFSFQWETCQIRACTNLDDAFVTVAPNGGVVEVEYSSTLHEKLTRMSGNIELRVNGRGWLIAIPGLDEILNHPDTNLKAHLIRR